MWRSRQLLYVKLSQFNLQFEPVSLCEVLKKPKSIATQATSTITIQHALGVLHCVVVSNCTLDVLGTIMGLEASDDALVHRLDVHCEIWFEIHNADVLKSVWDDVT